MKAWIRKNWLVSIFGMVALALIFMNVDSCVDKRNYRYSQRESDKEIVSLKRNIRESHSRATVAITEAREAEEEARKERAEKEKHKANEARLEEEKKELRARIASLPPTQIVIRTVEILRVKPEEITLRPQGVLFTLVATRRNLEYLEEFTLVKKQYGELRLSLARSEASEAKLLEANAKKDIAINEKNGQLAKWVMAEMEWKNKFRLSEYRAKRMRAKGRKEGSIVGAIIGGIIGFFLGK